MSFLRNFLHDHRRLAALVIALTLAMKALVPTGFLVEGGAKVITVHICTDTSGAGFSERIVVPQTGKSSADRDGDHTAHTHRTCHFAGLGDGAASVADAAQVVLAIAVLLVLGFAISVPSRKQRIWHLRPHLRGPPPAG